MPKPLAHQIAGYNRDTDELVVEYEIDTVMFEKIRKFVSADADDPGIIYSYPLKDDQLDEISALLGTKLDGDQYEFFLEPSEGSANE